MTLEGLLNDVRWESDASTNWEWKCAQLNPTVIKHKWRVCFQNGINPMAALCHIELLLAVGMD